MNSARCSNIDYYQEAVEYTRCNRLMDAFEDYCKVFFPPILEHDWNRLEFTAFFRYQLATYLSKKNNYFLGLPEGDMITDLILMYYNEFLEEVSESQIPLSKEGRRRLLSNVKIIFPCHFDAE
ncbi:MAG: hypothetical protein KBS81_10100 [Spirochaetales bacterium]|nr:hypothetical protein [Candidatus Physcosoma equi]